MKNTSLKLTITWLLLVASTILSVFVVDLNQNGNFISILAYKKFMLIGFIYLEGMKTHWFYKVLLVVLGAGLFMGDYIWEVPKICS